MHARWYICDYRHLPISFTLDGPGGDGPDALRVFVLDLSIRPFCGWHYASLWTGPVRCGDFAFILASFARFGFVSGHFDIDELTIYPDPLIDSHLSPRDNARREVADRLNVERPSSGVVWPPCTCG